MTLAVRYEDNHLLVIFKPAGRLVQSDATGDRSLVDDARDYRIQSERKIGNAFIGLVHRLDRPVSGLVALAKTSKGAARLSEEFRRGLVEKRYLAVVTATGKASPIPLAKGAGGVWSDRLRKDERSNVVRVANAEDSRDAKTCWRCLEVAEPWRLLELAPITGRSHQLRVQASARGWPIVGDLKYGSPREFAGQLALHAYVLGFKHPTRDERLRFVEPPPASWTRFPFADAIWRQAGRENWPSDEE